MPVLQCILYLEVPLYLLSLFVQYHKGKFIHTLCHECSAYFRKGFFCPICLKVYHDDETDSPMVCCDSCDRWIHTGNLNIQLSLYLKTLKCMPTFVYTLYTK